jgi:nucleotide-binding universal stress UspA family protein
MVILKHILVATDFSEPSGVALAYGRDLARAYGATLHVLHVLEDMALRYSPEIGFSSVDVMHDFEKVALRDLEALITADDRQCLTVLPVVEIRLNVASGIVEYARAHEVDLVIVGTHGRSAVKHFLVGSVAERVVRSAPCPVLAVRVHERDFIAPDALVAAVEATPPGPPAPDAR